MKTQQKKLLGIVDMLSHLASTQNKGGLVLSH